MHFALILKLFVFVSLHICTAQLYSILQHLYSTPLHLYGTPPHMYGTLLNMYSRPLVCTTRYMLVCCSCLGDWRATSLRKGWFDEICNLPHGTTQPDAGGGFHLYRHVWYLDVAIVTSQSSHCHSNVLGPLNK